MDINETVDKYLSEGVKFTKGQSITIDWMKGGNNSGVITGVGADYIKFKLKDDKTPHDDTSMVYFNDFKKYNVRVK